MDEPWIRTVSQSGVYVTFALYLVWAARRGVREWAPLIAAFGYAVLFEHWNMLRYAHSPGGYHYHSASWLWLWGDVPLYIPLAWAFILATSRALTDRLGLKPWARPFADALFALLIDASMDAVAIRLSFWTWHGIRWNEGFFGVPADNFVGWLLVSFTFSALTRWVWREDAVSHRGTKAQRDKAKTQDDAWEGSHAKTQRRKENRNYEEGRGETPGVRSFLPSPAERSEETRGEGPGVGARILTQFLIVPPAAYILYLALEGVVHLGYALFHADTLRGQLLVLAGVVVIFASVAAAGMRRTGGSTLRSTTVEAARHSAAVMHGPRHIFHLFGLVGLLFVPAVGRSAALWALAVGVWSIELAIALFMAKRVRQE